MRTRSAVVLLCLSFYWFATLLSAQKVDACRVTLNVPSKIDLTEAWDATVEVEGLTLGDNVYVLSRLARSGGRWRVWMSGTKAKTMTFKIYLQAPATRFFDIRAVVVRETLPEGEVEGPANPRCDVTRTVPNSGSERGRSGKR